MYTRKPGADLVHRVPATPVMLMHVYEQPGATSFAEVERILPVPFGTSGRLAKEERRALALRWAGLFSRGNI